MITSITLQGFKSFAERTRLEFGPGITAVIGPNGSGKSNVVEALRWVSHQARARELRAARATELIFHGSAGGTGGGGIGKAPFGMAPLGMAEVQLELRTHTGDRLHLTRRIYRDGSAEQDVMGRPARARDVQGSLRGTGLGSGGLAVIGQGEVGSVVQAEGQTLLAYVQEAAGLSRSVVARQDTTAQLRAAETQLAQVRLIEAELEGRTRRLHLAAEAASRHRALSLKALHLQDALTRSRHLAALGEVASLRGRITQLADESQTLSADVQRAAAELEQARNQVAEARERGRAHAQTLELFRAAQRGDLQASTALNHLDRDLAALDLERGRLDLNPPLTPAPDPQALQAELATASRELATRTRGVRDLETHLTQAREQAGRLAQQQAARGAQHGTLQAEADRLAGQLAEESAALKAARAEAERLSGAAATLEQAHAALQDRHAALLEQQRAGQSILGRLQAELPPLRREQERLEASLNGYARYGEGPRRALQSDHPGIVGSVADLLVVPAEHETAVGAALGRRLEQVVVQTADDAREIIDLLKRGGGRATFLPLDLLRPRQRRDGALLRENGVLGNLSDLCLSDPPIVGQNLLSDTLLMQDLQAATALARRHASRPRLVTVDGELLEPGGSLTGGRLRDSGAAVLGDQRRFAELQDELGALQQRQLHLTAEQDQRGGEVDDAATRESVARAARDQSRERMQEAGLQLATLEARTASLAGQRRALLDQLGAADVRETIVQEVTSVPLTDVAQLEAVLEGARHAADLVATQERILSAAVVAARDLQAAWTAHHGSVGRAEELQARRTTLEERRALLQTQLTGLQAETTRLQADLADLNPDELPAAQARQAALSLTYSTLIAGQNRVAGLLEEARLTQARREGALQDLPDGALPSGQPRDWQQSLSLVTRELETLGTVNPAAAHELETERERLEALSGERQDVDDAVTELRAHLGELAQAEEEATGRALRRVGRAFTDYSGELLGGLGDLEQERDPEGRLLGLRLAVQPKGKRTRSLTLLSAGERTMAGLAFLFALGHAPEEAEAQAAGLPLAVLDEVDAPLDEANIRRFTRFLTLFAARGSQFVLVTHQKATMEVASALWGVTTEASGVSRVLSIRQTEDQAH
ncbi:AAA family ATPase [Deinococcus sp.]|uniref:AAA family ATPase n=1 Tax=Deinococcus sp. TaxID=47478 RepID=UPI003C7CAC3C